MTGTPEIVGRAAAFHRGITDLVSTVLTEGSSEELPPEEKERVRKIALVLQQTWFAGLVGWMGGMYTQSEVLEQVEIASDLVLRE